MALGMSSDSGDDQSPDTAGCVQRFTTAAQYPEWHETLLWKGSSFSQIRYNNRVEFKFYSSLFQARSVQCTGLPKVAHWHNAQTTNPPPGGNDTFWGGWYRLVKKMAFACATVTLWSLVIWVSRKSRSIMVLFGSLFDQFVSSLIVLMAFNIPIWCNSIHWLFSKRFWSMGSMV